MAWYNHIVSRIRVWMIALVLTGLSPVISKAQDTTAQVKEALSSFVHVLKVFKTPLRTIHDAQPHFSALRWDAATQDNEPSDLGCGVVSISYYINLKDWISCRAEIYLFRDTVYYQRLYAEFDTLLPQFVDIATQKQFKYTIENGVFLIEYIDHDRVAAMRAALDAEFGRPPVPRIITKDSSLFRFAMMAGGDLPFGTVCGLRMRPLELHTMIEEMVANGNIDALISLTRGVSPSGRAMATIALGQLQAKGISLSPDVTRTMKHLRSSKVQVPVCGGCLIHGMDMSEAIKMME